MFKRIIPLAIAATLGLSLAGCYENEPEGGGGGANPSSTVIDLDNDGVIERGEPGFIDRDGDGLYDGVQAPDLGEPETPNEPIGPGGE